MIYTKHAQKRFAQRGINKAMVSIVMDYGFKNYAEDRWTLGRKQAGKIIDILQEEIKCLKKIQDKGGITIIESDGHILTALCN